jgi:hypothetical protein
VDLERLAVTVGVGACVVGTELELRDCVTLELRDRVRLTVALLQPLMDLGAVVAIGLELRVVEVQAVSERVWEGVLEAQGLTVGLRVEDRVALPHLEEEAQPVTEGEGLSEGEVDLERLAVTVGVEACVVGTDVRLMLPEPHGDGLDEEEAQELCDRVTLTVALLQPLMELGAVVAAGLGLRVVEVQAVTERVWEGVVEAQGLMVRLPVEERVALAHLEAEAQAVMEEETLGEREALGLVVPLSVGIPVVLKAMAIRSKYLAAGMPAKTSGKKAKAQSRKCAEGGA